ncbi:MAG: hypothetical protein ACOZBZ_04245 [Patescibacteria group bacterium]
MKSKTKQQILNLSADLRRISWWACDRKTKRDALIERFLNLTKKQKQILERENSKVGEIVERKMLADWPKVKGAKKDRLVWAEETLTSSLRLKHLVTRLTRT